MRRPARRSTATTPMRDSVKKKAPVQTTGGGGSRYENAVGARFLLDLLGRTNALGVDFGRMTRIDWQARDAAWLADDIVITCKAPIGDRTAATEMRTRDVRMEILRLEIQREDVGQQKIERPRYPAWRRGPGWSAKRAAPRGGI